MDRSYDTPKLYADLRAALETAYVHCKPGGGALFAPEPCARRSGPIASTGATTGRGARYARLEWVWDPDPSDTTCDFAYLLREGERVRVEHSEVAEPTAYFVARKPAERNP